MSSKKYRKKCKRFWIKQNLEKPKKEQKKSSGFGKILKMRRKMERFLYQYGARIGGEIYD
ncbi:MAG: hypothetical protein WCI41_00950 [bacterium]